MIETLLIIDEILCIICIIALALFCAVLYKTGIAKYFYILFGITLLPIGIKLISDGTAWYKYIWFFLFAIVAIISGIMLIIVNNKMTKEQKEKFNRNFWREGKT